MNIVNPYRFEKAGIDLTGLNHYWRLESDANDYVGSSNATLEVNITYDTADLPPFASSKANWVTADDSRIAIPHADTMLGNSDGISWTFWVRLTAASGAAPFLQKRRLTPSQLHWNLRQGTNNALITNLWNSDGSGPQWSRTNMYDLNQWTMITVVYDKVGMLHSTRKNKGSIVTYSAAGHTGFGTFDPPLWIGNDRGRTGGVNKSIQGSIAGAAIWEGALSEQQIDAIYDHMVAGNHLI